MPEEIKIESKHHKMMQKTAEYCRRVLREIKQENKAALERRGKVKA